MDTGMLAILSMLWVPPNFDQRASEVDKADSTGKDVDQIALKGLRVATDLIPTAHSYSFRALANGENLGPKERTITLLPSSEITVQHPDRLHVNSHGSSVYSRPYYQARRLPIRLCNIARSEAER
jgi:hypothetical protein